MSDRLKPGTWVRYHGKGPYPARDLIDAIGIIVDERQNINWVFQVSEQRNEIYAWEPRNYEAILEPTDELDETS